jgi:hypothetical protein
MKSKLLGITLFSAVLVITSCETTPKKQFVHREYPSGGRVIQKPPPRDDRTYQNQYVDDTLGVLERAANPSPAPAGLTSSSGGTTITSDLDGNVIRVNRAE